MQRRVVITGLGVLAPNGSGKEAFWSACLQGRSGIRPITRFDASPLPVQIAGEIATFDPEATGLTAAECQQMDRGTQFAVAAAGMALEDAGLRTGLSEEERRRTGVFLGTAMASVEEGERLWLRLTDGGRHAPENLAERETAFRLIAACVPSAAVSAHHRLYGPCMVISTGCSAGADAIGQAFWAIQEGRADRMLAGGCDSAISLGSLNVFCVMRALSTRNAEPERASRPYDALRDGFVMAEGAGVLLLEAYELALARGAQIYAEIVAFVSNSNAYHMTALPEDGAPLQDLLRAALAEAHIEVEQLGYINSHGSSTPPNEVAETAAYKAVFGERARAIPISATKSMIGHTQGAASAIETIATALAIKEQLLPPTINQEVADPQCDLDYVPNRARAVDSQRPLNFALTHSSGFGGVNTALVLARCQPSTRSSTAAHPTSRAPGAARPLHGERRAVITGLGALTACGPGTAALWDYLSQGRCAIGALTRLATETLPIQVAGEVRNFRAEEYIERKLAQRTDRMTHFALVAADEALRDSGLRLEEENPHRVGTVIANTLGGTEYVLEQVRALYVRGPRFMSAYTAIAWLQVANAGQISLRYGLQGYCKVPVNDTAGGLDALGLAREAIERDAADIVIAGGSEALLHPCVLLVLAQSGQCSLGSDPEAYRPFDRRAAGLVLAEGAGICIVEEYEHARRRGASIYGEIAGYAQSCSALRPGEAPGADERQYARTLCLALQEARVTAAQLGYVSPDGRALPAWDAAEAQALQRLLGPAFPAVPVSVPRTATGHSYAAAGALDAITALLAMRMGLIPPTLHCEEPAPHVCPPSLVRAEVRPLARSAQAVLLSARSLSGVNSALVLRRV